MAKSLTEMAVEIITAQLSHRDMSADEIAEVLRNTFGVLRGLKDMEVRREFQGAEIEPANRVAGTKAYPPPESPVVERAEAPVPKQSTAKQTEAKQLTPPIPAMEPMDSIQEDKIICLECGQEFKQISHTHLKNHSLTPKDYRKKYHLPKKQPLTARSLSEKRKQKARESGLGSHLKSLREAKRKA
jgi:predicted transcriptional regulator